MARQIITITSPMPQTGITWTLAGSVGAWMAVLPLSDPNPAAGSSLVGLSLAITDSTHTVNDGVYPIIAYDGTNATITSTSLSNLLSSSTITVNSIVWTVPAGVTSCRVIGLGGGGGGGASGGAENGETPGACSGAGGAGAQQAQQEFNIFSSPQINPGAQIPIVVGQGGAGGTTNGVTQGGSAGTNGSNSTFGGSVPGSPGGSAAVVGWGAQGGQGGNANVGGNQSYSAGGVAGSGNYQFPYAGGSQLPVISGYGSALILTSVAASCGGWGTSLYSEFGPGSAWSQLIVGGGNAYARGQTYPSAGSNTWQPGGSGGSGEFPGSLGGMGGLGKTGAGATNGNAGVLGGGGGGGGATQNPSVGVAGNNGGAGGSGVVQLIFDQ